ncbi:unnamed protein product, partial [Ectocarpus sp. 12 AP-2014]
NASFFFTFDFQLFLFEPETVSRVVWLFVGTWLGILVLNDLSVDNMCAYPSVTNAARNRCFLSVSYLPYLPLLSVHSSGRRTTVDIMKEVHDLAPHPKHTGLRMQYCGIPVVFVMCFCPYVTANERWASTEQSYP